MLPVPCNPDTLAMAYALRKPGGGLVPLTRFVDPPPCWPATAAPSALNATSTCAASSSSSSQPTTRRERRQLPLRAALLPARIDAPSLSYRDVFRVLIVQFMDAQSPRHPRAQKSCVHMAQADGRMIPFEAYNLFYRDEKAVAVARIREGWNPHGNAQQHPNQRKHLAGCIHSH